jgi:hypothetical protein
MQWPVFHHFDWSSLVYVFCFCLFHFCDAFLSQIEKTDYESENREPVMQSLSEGLKFVFNNKTVLGAITLDMVAVLLETVYITILLKTSWGPEGLAF